jgi:hypothetical protein
MIPKRYASLLLMSRIRTVGIRPQDDKPVETWICILCGQGIKPNPAGAQSHLAKHLRELEARENAG